MSVTYSGDPANSDLDAVRFELGDTDLDHPLFTDEELQYLIGQEGSVLAAAARACDILAQRYAQEAEVSVGDLKISYSDAAKSWADRARELRNRLVLGQAKPQIYSSREPMFRTDQWTFDGGRDLEREQEN